MTGCRKSTQAWCVTLLGDFSFRALEGVRESVKGSGYRIFLTVLASPSTRYQLAPPTLPDTFSDIKVALRNEPLFSYTPNMVWI